MNKQEIYNKLLGYSRFLESIEEWRDKKEKLIWFESCRDRYPVPTEIVDFLAEQANRLAHTKVAELEEELKELLS